MRRVVVPVVLGTLALLAGCGGSADPAPAPAPSSPSGSSVSPSVSPSTGVASGVDLVRPHSTVTAPSGWTRGRAISSDATAADSPDRLAYVELAEIEAFGSTMGAAELGRTRISSSIDARPPKLLPVAELDGVPVYHVAGLVNDEQYLEEYGAIRDDRIVTLTFSFNTRFPAGRRQQVVEQVLATFRWR